MDMMTGAEMAQGRYRTPHEISMNYLGVRRRSAGADYPRCHRLTRVHETLRDAVPRLHDGSDDDGSEWDAGRAAEVYQVLFGQTGLDTPLQDCDARLREHRRRHQCNEAVRRAARHEMPTGRSRTRLPHQPWPLEGCPTINREVFIKARRRLRTGQQPTPRTEWTVPGRTTPLSSHRCSMRSSCNPLRYGYDLSWSNLFATNSRAEDNGSAVRQSAKANQTVGCRTTLPVMK
jgi:hypothetical protein